MSNKPPLPFQGQPTADDLRKAFELQPKYTLPRDNFADQPARDVVRDMGRGG